MQYPTFGAVVEDTNQARDDFFKLVFGPEATGYISIAFLDKNKRDMRTFWFKYPEQMPELLSSIIKNSETASHAYFCPHLFKAPTKREKSNVSTCTNVWADLDTCNPALLNVEPTVVIQTSPGRFQALWVLDRPIAPSEAEDISRRIAYFHANQGADRSGWDLSQLLRIPYTANYKYGDENSAPVVGIVTANRKVYRKRDFDRYPEIPATEFVKENQPELLDDDPLNILQRFRTTLNPLAFSLYNDTPTEDTWSEKLWKLLQILVEAGLSRQQTFTVANSASCNKFARDGRPQNDLWQEVCRAYIKHLEITNSIPTPETVIHELLTPEEVEMAQRRETFIERYIKWATGITDASPQYHQAGAFTLLSSLVSGSVRLETSGGEIIPNLWFSILGETTLTRKSTAMRIAVNLLKEIDDDVMFATDGTSEGILTGLQGRDGKASLFYRDEITGLFQAMLSKEYMSDMPEHLTKLYDGDVVKRLLRREEITVKNPVFLMLCGGIKTKVQLMLSEEHIASGFIPRFIFITAEADISRLRPLGPKVSHNDEWRETIKNELIDLRIHYNQDVELRQGKKVIGYEHARFEVSLTDAAWKRYTEFELLMIRSALDTGLSYLTPVYDRLSKSTLKAAILIAASRQRETNVLVELDDLLHAIYYCRQWRTYANDVVNSVGKSENERLMETMLHEIKNSTTGKTRHELMREHRLSKKAANELFDTMEQRQWIDGTSYGRDIRYHAI